MQTTKVIKCACEHFFQDQRYGAMMRVHNAAIKGNVREGWRCTVCGHVVPDLEKLAKKDA